MMYANLPARSRFVSAVLAAITLSSLAEAQVNEDFKLIPSDGAADDRFGYSVAISGTTAIVGAGNDDDNGTNSGSAYLFDVTTGRQLAKLLPADGAAGDRFGISVAISGTTAVVGALYGSGSGSAYVFDATTGQQHAKLLPIDGSSGDRFGWAVATTDTVVVVGATRGGDNGVASGSTYVFDAGTGQQLWKLLPGDGANGDEFGNSVGISGTTAIVGALYDGDNGLFSGSAYLFDVATGQELLKLLPSDGAAEDFFGISVSISGTRAVVGAHFDDDNGNLSGSAYIFDAASGLQTAKLLPPDGSANDGFGASVSISGTTIAIGCVNGLAYAFDAPTGQQIAKLLPSIGTSGSGFGGSAATSGTAVAVGASGDDPNGIPSGSAYLYRSAFDCNTNGIPDSDDIANGTSQDCDGNGQPDECQLADPSNDWNGDGERRHGPRGDPGHPASRSPMETR